jgi:cyclophilin family peptidyl-prolyl cis-trans isomerase
VRALLIVLVASAVAAGCGGGGGSTDTSTTSASPGGCESAEAPSARDPGSHEAPTEPLAAGKTYSLVVDTNCGSFTVELDLYLAPKTTASLVELAKDGYFDDTIFHRVVPGFVIQGGDPSQSGSGGPGYTTVDVPPAGAKYTKGVVAMAKGGTEPPGTSGSQFFVVTTDDAGLPPDYAIVGKVTDGMDAVKRIDALGVGDGPPSQPVVVKSVTVDES